MRIGSRAVRASLRIVSVAFLVYVGTLVLANGAPNYFISAGVAVFCYGLAIAILGGEMFKASILRIKWFSYALMFSLLAVGAAVQGGPVGITCAILFGLVATFWWWLVAKITLG